VGEIMTRSFFMSNGQDNRRGVVASGLIVGLGYLAKPNAGRQLLSEAGARHERRLEAVSCTRLIGGRIDMAWHIQTRQARESQVSQ